MAAVLIAGADAVRFGTLFLRMAGSKTKTGVSVWYVIMELCAAVSGGISTGNRILFWLFLTQVIFLFALVIMMTLIPAEKQFNDGLFPAILLIGGILAAFWVSNSFDTFFCGVNAWCQALAFFPQSRATRKTHSIELLDVIFVSMLIVARVSIGWLSIVLFQSVQDLAILLRQGVPNLLGVLVAVDFVYQWVQAHQTHSGRAIPRDPL
jgi:hypothetical protein